MMIQHKWFSVEHLKDGSLGEVKEVEAKGRNGAVLRFYEAADKAGACSLAKRWWADAKNRQSVRNTSNRISRAARGVCTRCGVTPVKNKPVRIVRGRKCLTAGAVCESCKSKRGSGPARPKYATPEEALAAHRERKNRWHKDNHAAICHLTWRRLLREFDELGPVAFRAWLVSKIPAMQQTQEEWHPPMTQAAE